MIMAKLGILFVLAGVVTRMQTAKYRDFIHTNRPLIRDGFAPKRLNIALRVILLGYVLIATGKEK